MGLVVGLDLETLGLSDGAHIAEIGFVGFTEKFQPLGTSGGRLHKFSSLIRATPEQMALKEAQEALAVNKILPDKLLAAREAGQVRLRAIRWLQAMKEANQGQPLVLLGHNIGNFDIPRLRGFFGGEVFDELFSKEYVDTMHLAARVQREPGKAMFFGRLSLESINRSLGLSPVGHRVIPDILASAEAAEALSSHLGAVSYSRRTVSEIAAGVERMTPRRGWGYLGAGIAVAAYLTKYDSEPQEPPSGIRQPDGTTTPEQFEAMNPHPEYGFPGGADQPVRHAGPIEARSGYNMPKMPPGLVQAWHDRSIRSKIPSQVAKLPRAKPRTTSRGAILSRRER